jgi:CO/xanthine dehydrogenase Mo-binding subunit
VEDGVVLNPNMVDYIVPSIGMMPALDSVSTLLAPAPHEDGPYGAKGLGEL